MIGDGYWATGITVRYGYAGGDQHGWHASADYYDNGFCDDHPDAGQVSTQGRLQTRYYVRDGERRRGLTAALDILLADAERLGIRFSPAAGEPPMLYVEGDGEDPDVELPDGWRALLAAEAKRIGWRSVGDITGGAS